MSKHLCLPIVEENPDISKLPDFMSTAGFRPLIEASPEILPSGALVVLYDIQNNSTQTVICRRVEMNNGFFYLHKLGPYFDSWRYLMIMGDSLKNYLYKVIS